MIEAAERGLQRVRERRPDVYALAMLASVSPRITPDLLRDLRLNLGPEAYAWILKDRKALTEVQRRDPDADTEASLWFNPLLVRGRGPEGIALHPDVAHRLRVTLKDSPFLGRANATLERYRRSFPAELDWQAQISMALLARRDSEVEQLEGEVLAILRKPDERELPRAVAQWLLGEVHPAMPELRRVPLALASEIAAGQRTNLKQPLLEHANVAALKELASYDLSGWVRMAQVVARREGGLLQLGTNLDRPTYTFELPVTNPFVVRVVNQQAGGREDPVTFSPGGPPTEFEVGLGPIELRDVLGRTFRLDERPISVVPRPRPWAGGDLHPVTTAADTLVGRDADVADILAWLEGSEPLRVLVGSAGRGKQRLSDEVASRFRGRRFVGHVRDTKGLPGLLFKLAEFLGVPGPWALSQALTSPAAPTLIVLQGLADDDFQNENLTAFIAALRSQSLVKLLLTARSAPSGLPVRDIPALTQTAVDTALQVDVPSPEVRRSLAFASGGEPLLVQLLRAAARGLGADAAAEIGATFASGEGIAEKVRRTVAELMRRQPNRYLEIIGDLAVHESVAAALSDLYQRIETPDPALSNLTVWCNDKRDSRVRQAILAAMDANGNLPSRNVIGLLERLGIWAPTDDMIREWPFWAATANMLADVLKRRDDATREILEDLGRRETTRWRQEQILGIALPKSGLLEAGDPLANELSDRLWDRATERRDTHRQAAWTLAKDIKSIGEARKALSRFATLDQWARTRLIISLAQLPTEMKDELGEISLEPADDFVTDPANSYIPTLLLFWTQHPQRRHLAKLLSRPTTTDETRTLAQRLGLPTNHLFARQPDLLAPPIADEARMEEVVRSAVRQYLDGAVNANELQVLGDLIALEIDSGANTSGRPLKRYDIFEAFATDALVAADRRALDVITVLARCLDEGIRWAVAQRFKPAYTKAAAPNRRERRMPSLYELVAPASYWEAARLLAGDENEWVVRDTLAGVADLWPSTSRAGIDATGAAALAEPARDWREANYHRGEDQLFDVTTSIDRLRAVCPPFAVRWDELTKPATRP